MPRGCRWLDLCTVGCTLVGPRTRGPRTSQVARDLRGRAAAARAGGAQGGGGEPVGRLAEHLPGRRGGEAQGRDTPSRPSGWPPAAASSWSSNGKMELSSPPSSLRAPTKGKGELVFFSSLSLFSVFLSNTQARTHTRAHKHASTHAHSGPYTQCSIKRRTNESNESHTTLLCSHLVGSRL